MASGDALGSGGAAAHAHHHAHDHGHAHGHSHGRGRRGDTSRALVVALEIGRAHV